MDPAETTKNERNRNTISEMVAGRQEDGLE